MRANGADGMPNGIVNADKTASSDLGSQYLLKHLPGCLEFYDSCIIPDYLFTSHRLGFNC